MGSVEYDAAGEAGPAHPLTPVAPYPSGFYAQARPAPYSAADVSGYDVRGAPSDPRFLNLEVNVS
jgi:hypothetical protein